MAQNQRRHCDCNEAREPTKQNTTNQDEFFDYTFIHCKLRKILRNTEGNETIKPVKVYTLKKVTNTAENNSYVTYEPSLTDVINIIPNPKTSSVKFMYFGTGDQFFKYIFTLSTFQNQSSNIYYGEHFTLGNNNKLKKPAVVTDLNFHHTMYVPGGYKPCYIFYNTNDYANLKKTNVLSQIQCIKHTSYCGKFDNDKRVLMRKEFFENFLTIINALDNCSPHYLNQLVTSVMQLHKGGNANSNVLSSDNIYKLFKDDKNKNVFINNIVPFDGVDMAEKTWNQLKRYFENPIYNHVETISFNVVKQNVGVMTLTFDSILDDNDQNKPPKVNYKDTYIYPIRFATSTDNFMFITVDAFAEFLENNEVNYETMEKHHRTVVQSLDNIEIFKNNSLYPSEKLNSAINIFMQSETTNNNIQKWSKQQGCKEVPNNNLFAVPQNLGQAFGGARQIHKNSRKH